MSASLVGSEMCIRDSAPPTQPTSASGARRMLLWGVREGWSPTGESGVGSVSYTHLTLPTICSV
eukprot:15059247-Alexandrium_andersonii.AAC.1